MKFRLFGYTINIFLEKEEYCPNFKEVIKYLETNTVTSAGRLEIANNLLKLGKITKPEQYLQILNMGTLNE